MAKNECPECLKKINAVIANKDSGFDETDREWLEVLSEAALDKAITPKVIEKEVEKIVEKEVNVLSDEDKSALADYRKQLKEKRDSMIQSIQANTSKEAWPDAVLNEMKDDVLERIHNSVRKEDEVDYSLGAPRKVQINECTEEPLYLTGQFVETAKKEE